MKKIFFAYEGHHPDISDSINYGIREYNKHQKSYKATTWENLKIGGQILNSTVLKAIDECEIFTSDLTYQNHNVLFELGYAIGKQKRILLILNPHIIDAKKNYSTSRILKNIGYNPFCNGKDVLKILDKNNLSEQIPIFEQIYIEEEDIDSYDFLFLSSKIQNQAALELERYLLELKEAKIINNNSAEVEYQTMVWYLKSISKCKNILIHLLGKEILNETFYNAEYSLFTGLACGMNKNVMLIAPKPFKAPIDYSDILIEYDDAEDCILKTSSWVENRLLKKVEVIQKELIEEEDNLIKLGIGCAIAEEEEKNLLSYFVEIDSYDKTLQRRAVIITGRKGAGKSALYIRLREYFYSYPTNCINIFLKPESDELVNNVELTKVYQNERTKKVLLLTVWRYVFYSQIFKGIYNIVSSQIPGTIDVDSLETKICDLYKTNEKLLEDGPFSALSKLYFEWQKNVTTQPEVLDQIYKNILSPIISIVKEYISKHKYTEINILADNLDKTWDSNSDLKLQAELILSLLEFNGKIPKELGLNTIKTHTIIILRTDIYEYIIEYAREPDKLELMRIEIDWNQFPQKLKELLENRFKFILNYSEKNKIEDVWQKYFDISKKKHPYEIINQIVLKRPRDIIYFVSKMFESAVNNNHLKVNSIDLDYSIEAYSNFLYQNMIAETKAQFPEVSNIFIKIQKTYSVNHIEFVEFIKILKDYKYNNNKIEKFIDFLISKAYLKAVCNNKDRYIDSYQDMIKLKQEKILFLFNKNKIYIILHPYYFQLKKFKGSI